MLIREFIRFYIGIEMGVDRILRRLPKEHQCILFPNLKNKPESSTNRWQRVEHKTRSETGFWEIYQKAIAFLIIITIFNGYEQCCPGCSIMWNSNIWHSFSYTHDPTQPVPYEPLSSTKPFKAKNKIELNFNFRSTMYHVDLVFNHRLRPETK